MTLPVQKGYYNETTQKVYPPSTSTWSGLSGSTWGNWREWAYSTEDQIVWAMPQINLGSTARHFTLDIETTAEGVVGYKIYTSMTGYLEGEETETIVAAGATDVPSFYGRFVDVFVIIDKVVDMPTLSNCVINVNFANTIEYKFTDLDSSTCDGTITARRVPLNAKVSRIVDMQIEPHETASPYNLDVYVTNTPTSTYLIPKIISKDPTNPTFALVGVDNHPRDGIVDLTITALPKQYMSGNNLKSA